MVVPSHRRSLLSNNAVPRADVLLPAEGSSPSVLLIPAFLHSLLVAYLHLYLGRTTPPALYVVTGLGAVVGHRLFHYAYRAVVGRNAERAADVAWCVGQGTRRPGVEIHGGSRDSIRHGHIRRPAAVTQERKRHRPFHRLDRRPRSRRRSGLEWIPDLWYVILACATAVADKTLLC